MYLVALGLLLAVCGTALTYLPAVWSAAPDVFWIIATMALGSLVLFKRHPAPAMLFALIGATFSESIFPLAGLQLPAMHIDTLAPIGMWVLLLLPAARLSQSGVFLVRIAIAINLAAFASAFFGYDTTSFWVASFAAATFSVTQRSFSIGAFSNPQIALSAAAIIPLATDLLAAQLGFHFLYGSVYITACNIWLSVAPLGCLIWLAVESSQRKAATCET